MLDKTYQHCQAEMKKHLQSIYDASDTKEARRLLTEAIDKFKEVAPNVVILLEESFDDIIAVTALSAKYRRRIRTTNGIGRLNEEIRFEIG